MGATQKQLRDARQQDHVRELRAEEAAGNITAGMLADLIELLNDKPKKLAIRRIPAKYARLASRAAKEPLPVESGPITGPLRDLMEFQWHVSETEEGLFFLEGFAVEDPAAFREVARTQNRERLLPLLKKEGVAAGAAAYHGEHRVNPARPEPRNSRCFLGNSVAEHHIRCWVDAWLTGYRKGYEAAGRADGWKHSPRGGDDKRPVPHPDFCPAMRVAFTITLHQKRAALARAKKYADVERAIRKAFRNRELLGANGKPITNRKAAADTYYKNLPLEKQRVFKSEPAACLTLQRALRHVKPRQPDAARKDASTPVRPRAPNLRQICATEVEKAGDTP